jgi:hypothetical protein
MQTFVVQTMVRGNMTEGLNSKQLHTLEAIYAHPIRANIAWIDIENLFVALGATVLQGRGSRVRVMLKGVKSVFHTPHPQKEANKGTVKSVQDFLKEANVSPDLPN